MDNVQNCDSYINTLSSPTHSRFTDPAVAMSFSMYMHMYVCNSTVQPLHRLADHSGAMSHLNVLTRQFGIMTGGLHGYPRVTTEISKAVG
jgi:hypothetical protein